MAKQTNLSANTALFRDWMSKNGIDVFIIPTMDPHDSEYVPAHWQCRQWITGFTGSAGTAVITSNEALLWTDSRYWLQAEQQLADTDFKLMKEGVDISVNEYLKNLDETVKICYCDDMMTRSLFEDIFADVHAQKHAVNEDPFDLFWTDRPALPYSPVEIISDDLAGESAASKIHRLEEWMKMQKSTVSSGFLVSSLASIAWLLNLRADDIPYNPFFISHLFISADRNHVLYINEKQISDEIKSYLDSLNISIQPYEKAPRHLEQNSPIEEWKALKNPMEQEGFREAHRRDGIALVKFLRKLDETPAEEWDELKIDEVLTACRAGQKGFRGLSFETIAAYGPHGAIVHYEATPETSVKLQSKSLILIDSGAHYDCGTTDITRTIALGELTEEEKRVYTLVLKGHLQMQNLHFPQNTTGLQIDTAARAAMWRNGYDYGHGTGHGIGHRLGVHEGPMQVRKDLRNSTILPMKPGQIITDEPGIYIAGKFGVRIENVLLCQKNPHNDFLHFEPLTLCPYDLRPVDFSLLTQDEIQWLNEYHQHVQDTLLPLLDDENDKKWLIAHTHQVTHNGI